MKKVLFIMLSLVLVASIGFGGAPTEKPLLRFAYAGLPPQRDIFIAQEMGFFKANGINVKLVKMQSTDVLPAIVGGRVDAGGVAPIAALAAIAQGVDIKAVVSGHQVKRLEGLAYVCVLKDSPIKTIKDLDGKSISGGLKGSCVWSWVKIAEKEHGIAFGQYIGAPPGQYSPMLLAGKVDSGVSFGTERLLEFKDKIRGILPLSGYAKIGCNSTHTWFSSQFLKEHPEAVRSFIAALQQARKYERDHPIEALRVATKYTLSTFEDLKASLEANLLGGFPSEVLIEVWQIENAQRAALDLGLLDKPLDIKKLVDTRFAKPVWEMPKGELDWLQK